MRTAADTEVPENNNRTRRILHILTPFGTHYGKMMCVLEGVFNCAE